MNADYVQSIFVFSKYQAVKHHSERLMRRLGERLDKDDEHVDEEDDDRVDEKMMMTM